METFTINIYQPTEVVNNVATLLGWDGTGSAKDFILSVLGPKVQDAIADIMLQPAKDAAQKSLSQAVNRVEEEQQVLEGMKPQLLESIELS